MKTLSNLNVYSAIGMAVPARGRCDRRSGRTRFTTVSLKNSISRSLGCSGPGSVAQCVRERVRILVSAPGQSYL